MYGQIEFLRILQDFIPYMACCPKRMKVRKNERHKQKVRYRKLKYNKEGKKAKERERKQRIEKIERKERKGWKENRKKKIEIKKNSKAR